MRRSSKRSGNRSYSKALTSRFCSVGLVRECPFCYRSVSVLLYLYFCLHRFLSRISVEPLNRRPILRMFLALSDRQSPSTRLPESEMSSSPESETTSIFSPPVTRATSATTRYSDASVDKITSNHSSRNELVGPRRMGRAQTTSTPFQSRTSTQSTRQRPHTLDPPLLQRNKSTKELINKFESLTKPQTPATSDDAHGRLGESQSTMFKPKARNPLRRSFGNLLAAFSKKLKPQVREKPSPSPSVSKDPPSPPPANAKIVPSCTHPSYRDLASLADTPIISGSALYLSAHASTEHMLPVWTECSIALYPTHILVTWHTTYGNPISHMIKLESCVDVRSIPLDELGEFELALLPDFDRKAFFLSFEGAPQEKFLVPSISERAKWVSSVWWVIRHFVVACKAGLIVHPQERNSRR